LPSRWHLPLLSPLLFALVVAFAFLSVILGEAGDLLIAFAVAFAFAFSVSFAFAVAFAVVVAFAFLSVILGAAEDLLLALPLLLLLL
jgi:hypothetical protein